ncbi:head GIN domain-containing protein [Alistipes sp. ZOR0009]|uniref:head GIN domain-containing protein n=1 Tax=Alistipes sp. ZOR0009 TaxID=1339253 RepID=UPI0006468742|nr:head GIN domain-containing protein [Alistipes sp. ZOR0009]
MKLLKISVMAIALSAAITTTAFAKSVSDESKAKRVFVLGNFSTVSVSSGIDLYLEPSAKNEATLITEKKTLNDVEVSLKGERLVIKLKPAFMRINSSDIKVYLSYKQIRGIEASGGSDVYMNNGATLKANALSLDASGGSDLKLKIETEKLDCSLSGGSDADLFGSATYANYDLSGGSDVKAKDLASKICKIDASGGSDATVNVSEDINADASGASDIYFYGNPKKRNISASGASTIKSK